MASLQSDITPGHDVDNRRPHSPISISSTSIQAIVHEVHQFQPAVDYSRTKQTEHYQVNSSPTKGSNQFQCVENPVWPDLQEHLPDCGAVLNSPQSPLTPTRTRAQRLPQTTPSSHRIANMGARRSQRSTMLLQSPARPGHGTRMRQIFQEASMENEVASDHGVSMYPQLPNISRVYTPLRSVPCPHPDSQLQLSRTPPKFDLKRPTEALKPCKSDNSAFWSDDSSYLITRSPVIMSSSKPSSRPEIDDWLSTVSRQKTPSRENISPPSPVLLSSSPLRKNFKSPLALQFNDYEYSHKTPLYPPICPTDIQRQDMRMSPQRMGQASEPLFESSSPLLTRTHKYIDEVRPDHLRHIGLTRISSPMKTQRASDTDTCIELEMPIPVMMNHALLRDGTPLTPLAYLAAEKTQIRNSQIAYDDNSSAAEFSPLSPNVCTERGPARHHSAKKPHQSTSYLAGQAGELPTCQSAKVTRGRWRRAEASATPSRMQRAKEKQTMD